jgi:hypothetical protein
MQNSRISMIGLGACCLFSVLLLSDDSWARPKKPPTIACTCTCRWEDVLGKEHFGPTDAVRFTESSLERCLGHKCTVTTPTGTYSGTTRNCIGKEQSGISRIPQTMPGTLQQTPTTPGLLPVPATGEVQRRSVEGEQPTSSEKEGK